ncbi:MAG: endonuclease III [Spirochaetaceae bacterium]|nr:MAG: endonuclease III [Spirochaetaceae bacterium]
MDPRAPTLSRFRAVLDVLAREYPETPSLLSHRSPFELLIGVILSAQTTDEQVNAVLPALFSRYPGPPELAAAVPAEVEKIIHSVGFFRRKALNIIGAAAHVRDVQGGTIPATMDELVRIPGVGRKSAGVILLHVYDKPAIIVDTHFGRVVRRLGYSDVRDPVRLERDVAAILPPELWNSASMRLNYHGRRYCFARKPACGNCPVAALCPSAGTSG